MKTIALIVEFSRMYGRSLLEGIAAYSLENRNWILRPLTPDQATPGTLKQFDGVIARIGDDKLEAQLRKSGLPVVDVYCRKPCPGFGMVDVDHKAIGRRAAEFFLQRGFKHLAFCGTPGLHFSDLRAEGFCSVPRPDDGVTLSTYESDHVFSPGDAIFFGEKPDSDPDFPSLAEWVKSLPKPVAVFCSYDLRALQLLRAAAQCGIRVPEEVALLGVDNDTIICSFAQVPISSIDPNAFQVGYEAGRMLDAMITGELPAEKRKDIRLVPPDDINERASTEFKPFEPAWMGKVLIQIEKNLRNSFSASDVFRVAGKSVSFVEATFKILFGMTVQRYINTVRMREAKRLLKEGRLPVTEIAYRCGYSSAQYFCRRFKGSFNTSPKRYGAAERAKEKTEEEPPKPKRKRGRPRKGEEVKPMDRARPPAPPLSPWKG